MLMVLCDANAKDIGAAALVLHSPLPPCRFIILMSVVVRHAR